MKGTYKFSVSWCRNVFFSKAHLGNLHSLLVNGLQTGPATLKVNVENSQKYEINLPYYPAIPPLAKKWKQPNYPIAYEWIIDILITFFQK